MAIKERCRSLPKSGTSSQQPTGVRCWHEGGLCTQSGMAALSPCLVGEAYSWDGTPAPAPTPLRVSLCRPASPQRDAGRALFPEARRKEAQETARPRSVPADGGKPRNSVSCLLLPRRDARRRGGRIISQLVNLCEEFLLFENLFLVKEAPVVDRAYIRNLLPFSPC